MRTSLEEPSSTGREIDAHAGSSSFRYKGRSPVSTGPQPSLPARRDRESGQAMVEFALILFPLLVLVAGIIYFGIGLNYWLDMQRIANQGARWAAVNNWPPECPRGSVSCTQTPACEAATRNGATLQNTLRCQALASGLEDNVQVSICYPAGTERVGDPVRVHLASDFNFFWVLDTVQIELVAEATMRLEQRPTLITGEVAPCP